jgi:hypothetical protein
MKSVAKKKKKTLEILVLLKGNVTLHSQVHSPSILVYVAHSHSLLFFEEKRKTKRQKRMRVAFLITKNRIIMTFICGLLQYILLICSASGAC